jgi:enamine deaminase RidA (YjgF/YER057c/UK114 family)
VVRSVVYVVSSDSGEVGGAWHRLHEHSELGPAFKAASTVVGVAVLGYQDQLVEVDLTARLPS